MDDKLQRMPLLDVEPDEALRRIVQGTAAETGARFFNALVRNLANVLGTMGAWVTEYDPEARHLRALAFWMAGRWVEGFEYDTAGTPCEEVVDNGRLLHVPDNIVELYPLDPDLVAQGAVSFLGVPLCDTEGQVLGHLAVIHDQPLPAEPRALALVQIFAARAAAELQRLGAERAVREREEKLSALVAGAMDAILELGPDLRVTLANAAAERMLGHPASRIVGADLSRFLTPESAEKLRSLTAGLEDRAGEARSMWIPGGLEAAPPGASPFRAEATLSRYESGGHRACALILRNVNDRLEAERRIATLTVQAEYLKEEIDQLQGSGEILGESEPLRRALQAVAQVAGTTSTVLLLGETGTGKELFARAIHAASGRASRPLIRLNCAAIPSTLIESELFGHEKGAFTGATQRREGRFLLADQGTLFLDEVGELSLEMQAKLLRVLQEGELEPVGSSHTHRVDVRVLAATNRNLEAEVQAGRFREDLYYRLAVFPIEIPPLRERGDDVLILARAFLADLARRHGRAVQPLSTEDERKLQAFPWPGNIRELRNVIERAVITARDGIPSLSEHLAPAPAREVAAPPAVLTSRELRELERSNIQRALRVCGGQVSGKRGAAALLAMKPSTLASRIKALGIENRRAR